MARAVLNAWNDDGNSATDLIAALAGPMANLRLALGERTHRIATVATHKPREGTKHQQVLALLRRTEGASGPAIAEAMGWAPHTVRGFLAGLSKEGTTVSVLERARQAGPNKAGARGSYTIYHIAD